MSTAAAAPQSIGGLSGNPSLVENRASVSANTDLIVPMAAGGMTHLVRVAGGTWLGPFRFAKDLREPVDAASMIQSTFNGNLEVVARVRYTLKMFWHAAGRWYGPMSIPAAPVTGIPCLIQSTFGVRGNFEIVVPLCGGRIGYISRDNDDPQRPWRSSVFGREPSEYSVENRVSAVALVQSGSLLEVIARYGVDLDVYWSEDPLRTWKTADARCYTGKIGAPGPVGNPAVVRSRIGSLPALEAMAPWSSGGLAHFYRETADPCAAWIGPTLFLTELGRIDDISLIESRDGNGGLLLAARAGNHVWFTSRDPHLRWSAPVPLLAPGPSQTK